MVRAMVRYSVGVIISLVSGWISSKVKSRTIQVRFQHGGSESSTSCSARFKTKLQLSQGRLVYLAQRVVDELRASKRAKAKIRASWLSEVSVAPSPSVSSTKIGWGPVRSMAKMMPLRRS